jgi:hypothetical protein
MRTTGSVIRVIQVIRQSGRYTKIPEHLRERDCGLSFSLRVFTMPFKESGASALNMGNITISRLYDIALIGHFFLHLPQRTHSMLLGVLYGSMSILHTREHAPHLVQLSELTLYLPGGSRLNNPKTAPTGHRYLQNGRLVSMHNKASAVSPITKGALICHSPNKLSSSATGQAISTANFKYRNTLSPLKVRTFLGNGILFIQSCK